MLIAQKIWWGVEHMAHTLFTDGKAREMGDKAFH